ERREGEKLLRAVLERVDPLPFRAALVDLLFQADDTAFCLRPLRIAGACSTHGFGGTVAVLAAFPRTLSPLPEPGSELDPKHAGICKVVILQSLRLRKQEMITGNWRHLLGGWSADGGKSDG